MANSNLKTLSEIFNEKIFKVPDYQRGYSWGEQQLEDLWRDIDNLPLGKLHYTGMITVDIQDHKVYHVIDGQQRLTSLIIFIKNILDRYTEEWITDDLEKSEAIKKYLYSKTKHSKNPKIIFGYYEDNPSFYFYKTRILDIKDKVNKKFETTLYTDNLKFANSFFKSKIIDKSQEELEELFIKITNQLKFNWYEIEKTDDLDEYVIFETMNNRGKPLSVLEILKNRLIYITTLFDNNASEKAKLRDDINEVWKSIFEYLGKDKKMDEDFFLKYHIVMYWGNAFDKTESFHKGYLLNDFFTIQKILNEKKESYIKAFDYLEKFEELAYKFDSNKDKNIIRELLALSYDLSFEVSEKLEDFQNEFEWCETKKEFLETYLENDYFSSDIEMMTLNIKETLEENYLYYDLVEDYISSLKDSIQSYYFILNPEKSNYDKEIKYWLSKINIIGFSEFMPILFSIFNHYQSKDKKTIIEILQYIENYLFVKKYCFTKGQQWLNRKFYLPAYAHNKNNDIEVLHDKLSELIYKGNQIINFDRDNFTLKIKKLFEDEEQKGFYSWKGLNYLLYEYEIYLQKEFHGEQKILWKSINKDSIEHIYPQTPKGTWIDNFSNLKNDKQRKKYCHALGNLLLLSKKKNSKASNKPFDEKKEIFSSGSFSEIEVSKYDDWTTKEIDERTEKILDFMNERWSLKLRISDIKKLK